ncbi:DUF2934 domain-containing protein [Rubellimicrobium aerolatum]|uniref:DUF2934 domain-containing protein n=1 Tax=Rubellimicrobium aerolatum TaxID=490979 RepID=A0ABW0S8K9_9RHOB|nr:DUF2934 domain-containing protein [Rubellimicrobium aerolatum]MBP1804634.1 hypothetical protein [Rubellimicrobium aerolatum]
MIHRDDRVRERAHAIWESEGRPEGRHEEHWRRAVEEIDRDSAGPFADAAPAAGGPGVDGNGLSSSVQPGGTIPGGGPGGGPSAGLGSLGTGGGPTADAPTGDPGHPTT